MKLLLNYLTGLVCFICLFSCSGTQTTPINKLDGTWVLTNVLMGDAMDLPCGFMYENKVREMSITFTSENAQDGVSMKLYGQSSVNTFTGSYSIVSYEQKTKTGFIKLSPLGTTKMASENADLMACENRFLTFLYKANTFKIDNGKLELSSTDSTGYNSAQPREVYKAALFFNQKK